jgi:hypothetical protein
MSRPAYRSPQVTASTLGAARLSTLLPARPYRWRGTPGWDPAAAAPIRKRDRDQNRAQEVLMRARRAEFARLREAGTGVGEAAQQVGVGRSRGREYERDRLAAIEAAAA